MRGRKPKPTILKLISGNPGKHVPTKQLEAQLASEPEINDTAPGCPEQLQDVERDCWDYLVSEMSRMGTLDSSLRGDMVAYCCSWATWHKATQELAKTGSEIVRIDGKLQKNPWLTVRNEALRDLSHYGGNLGLNLSQRAKIKFEPKPKSADPWSALK